MSLLSPALAATVSPTKTTGMVLSTNRSISFSMGFPSGFSSLKILFKISIPTKSSVFLLSFELLFLKQS